MRTCLISFFENQVSLIIVELKSRSEMPEGLSDTIDKSPAATYGTRSMSTVILGRCGSGKD